MVAVGGFLLVLVLLIAVTVLPVVAVIAILTTHTFAFFSPPLESGDTVTTVTSAYVSEFKYGYKHSWQMNTRDTILGR